jgi:hypothetical protein
MYKVAEASFHGLRGLIATAHIEAGKYAMAVPLSDGLFTSRGRQKSSPLPEWFVNPSFFTADHGCDNFWDAVLVCDLPQWSQLRSQSATCCRAATVRIA